MTPALLLAIALAEPGIGIGLGSSGHHAQDGEPAKTVDFWPAQTAGWSRLSSSVTINSTAVSPMLDYNAANAATTWTATGGAGVTLSLASSGTVPTTGDGSPIPGETSIRTQGGKVYQSGDTTTGDIVAEDMAIECLFQPQGDNGKLVSKWAGTGAGWEAKLESSGTLLRMTLADGTHTTQPSCGTINNGVWQLVHLFVDRSEASTNGFHCYINGQAHGSGVDSSTVTTTTNSQKVTVGGLSDLTNKLNGTRIAGCRVWKQSGWFAGGAQNLTDWAAIAEARAAQLFGQTLRTAGGATAPTKRQLTSVAHTYVLDGSNLKTLEKVDAYGPRLFERLDKNSTLLRFYMLQADTVNLKTNSALQSETWSSSWTKIVSGDTIGGSVTIPRRGGTETSATSCLVADNTNAFHGFSQAVTLSATHYVSSMWASSSSGWIYGDDTTVTGATAYFNLTSCTVGALGAGVSTATAESGWHGSMGCRVSFTVTGTAASHTFRWGAADGDGDSTVTGDGATTTFCGWGKMVENDGQPLRYIATTSSTLQDSADQVQFNSSSNVSPTKGSVICQLWSDDVNISTDDGHQVGTDHIYFDACTDDACDADDIVLRNESTYDKINWSLTDNTGRDIDIRPDFPPNLFDLGGHTARSSTTDGYSHSMSGSWASGPDVGRLWIDHIEPGFSGPYESPGHGTTTPQTLGNLRFSGIGGVVRCCVYAVPNVFRGCSL